MQKSWPARSARSSAAGALPAVLAPEEAWCSVAVLARLAAGAGWGSVAQWNTGVEVFL